MRLSEHVVALRVPFELPLSTGHILPRFVHMYILPEKRISLIDAGVKGAVSPLAGQLSLMGRELADIDCLLLTHGHPDHMGGASEILRESGCRTAAHPGDRAWIEDARRQEKERPVPGFVSLVEGGNPVGQLLKDGETVSCGRVELRVLHTPGHSPGHVCFLVEEDGLLLAGDALPQPGQMPIYDDVKASSDSLLRLLDLKGIKTMHSSWDEQVYQGEEISARILDGLAWVMKVHEAVRDEFRASGVEDPAVLTPGTASRLGLPPFAANPVMVRTVRAHLDVMDTFDVSGFGRAA